MAIHRSPKRAVLTIEVLGARCLPSSLGGAPLHHVRPEAHHGHHGRHTPRIQVHHEVHHHGTAGHEGQTETETETHRGKDG
jgi:hypothetical protein